MTLRLLGSILLVLGLANLSRAAEAEGGSCAAPQTAEPTSAVDVPQYAEEEDDDAPDPAAEAHARAWGDYQHQVFTSLKASSDPRDWAVAASFNLLLPSATARTESNALMRHAAKAAPDDVLVHWIVLRGARQLNATDLATDAVNRLRQIEPDNGEVWMEILQDAATRRDRAGVSAALRRMSATSHMDNHFSDVTKIVTEAFQRNPIPEEITSADDRGSSRKMSTYMYAMGVAAAFALPAYQHLTLACQWDESGRNADRAADCERAGRTMSQHGDTMIGQAIGFAVLRVSHTFNADDIEAARQVDWVAQNFSDIALKQAGDADGDGTDNTLATAFINDWMETGSETEAMRRRIVHDGLPPTPPDGWTSRTPRFAPERIAEGDKNGAEKLATAGY